MARSASKWFFEQMGLTPYGGVPGIPPKPQSARVIAKHGAALDRAEDRFDQVRRDVRICGPRWAEGVPPDEVALVLRQEAAIRCRFLEAKDRYSDAVYARVRFQKYKLETSKRIPKSADEITLGCARYAADKYYDLIDDLGELAYARELIDANAALMVANHAYDVARTKFKDAAREARADNRAGIVRTSYRRKPQEFHL